MGSYKFVKIVKIMSAGSRVMTKNLFVDQCVTTFKVHDLNW